MDHDTANRGVLLGQMKAASNLPPGYANAGSPPNFYDSVANAAGAVDVLATRLMSLADRLCGPVPIADSVGNLRAVSNGLLDDVVSKAVAIQAAVDAGQEALGRIERALP